jgi:hypothetical protein
MAKRRIMVGENGISAGQLAKANGEMKMWQRLSASAQLISIIMAKISNRKPAYAKI